MGFSIDGPTRLITLTPGTVSFTVPALYSAWVDWVALSDNAKFLPAFRTVGGDDVDVTAGTKVPAYCYLTNDWRVRPQEADHTLNVTGGVLLVDGGGDPFVNTTGDFIVRVNYSQPVQAITVATGGGSGGLTVEQSAQLFDVWQRLGLDPANPAATTDTSIEAGGVSQTIVVTAGPTVTVTRVP